MSVLVRVLEKRICELKNVDGIWFYAWLRNGIVCCKKKKNIEIKLYKCFVNTEKAFDMVATMVMEK